MLGASRYAGAEVTPPSPILPSLRGVLGEARRDTGRVQEATMDKVLGGPPTCECPGKALASYAGLLAGDPGG